MVLQSSVYTDVEACAACGLTEPLDPASTDNLVQPLSFDWNPAAPFETIAVSTALLPGVKDTSQSTLLYPYDVIGQPRLVGASQNRGAFQLAIEDALFGDGFED